MTDLPEGWRKETLERVTMGGTFSDGDWVETKDQDPSGDVRLTQLADVGVGTFRDRSDRWLREDQAERLNCTFLEPNDVLIARMPEPLGRACLVPDGIGRAITVVDVAIARLAREDIDPRFVMWAVNSPSAGEQILRLQSGTTRRRISRKNLATVRVPIPPLREQRRLVEILEDHLSRLDTADVLAEQARLRTPTLPEAVLSRWLTACDAPLLPLSALLHKPMTNGRSVSTQADGFPVLRLTALQGDRVRLSERKTGAWTAEEAQRFLVKRDDIFVSRGNGSLHLVGRASRVVEDPDSVAFPDTMIRIRPNTNVILPEYFLEIWNSRLVRQQIERMARTTAGIYKINQRDLGSIKLPVPTLDDQATGTAHVAEVREETLLISDAVTTSLARSRSLRQALLAAAFSGRLTGRSSDLDIVEEMAFA